MNQKYDLYLILNPELNAKDISVEIEDIKKILTENGATNIETTEEGVKRLAYPIRKSWNGFYVLFNFDLSLENSIKVNSSIKKINLKNSVFRHLLINITDFLVQKEKETLRQTEITSHRELNKGKKQKTCLSKFLGLREIDYRNVDYISQFTSPYAKIFSKDRTGTSAKYQRKISQAIKRARHMALMPFTTKHFS